MTDCKHNELKRIEGPLHGERDYVCKECGQQFRAEPLEISVAFGTPPKEGSNEE